MIEHENALPGRNDTVNYIEAIYSKLCNVVGGQIVEHGTNKAKVIGWIPRECMNWGNVYTKNALCRFR